MENKKYNGFNNNKSTIEGIGGGPSPLQPSQPGEKSFETGIRVMFDGYQPWFKIDHQTFYMATNFHAAPEENTEHWAKIMEQNLQIALQRLLNKNK